MEDNTISGNYGSEPNSVGTGILVEFADGSIRDNTVTDNQIGVHLEPGLRIELRSNTIRKSASNGIELFSTTNATIVENESSNNGGNSIYLAAGTTGNTVRENKAHGNGGIDVLDGNGKPLMNTYAANSCGTSNPNGLCKWNRVSTRFVLASSARWRHIEDL